MSKYEVKMTRQEMQNEAFIIQTLLSAALAMHSEPSREGSFEMIEKAQDRAHRLNIALDSVNAPEEMA